MLKSQNGLSGNHMGKITLLAGCFQFGQPL
jgi:hypothetical protein